jgi:endonuclease VIII
VPEGDTVFLAATRLRAALAGQVLSLDPETPVGRVPQPERLVALVRELFEGSKTMGSQLTTGDPRPGRRHRVYGRSGQPCRRCGTPVRVRGTREPGRATYWCPSCQPVSPP